MLCQKDFQKLGVAVHAATDDGSAGFKGYVRDLVRMWIADCGMRIREPKHSELRTPNDERRYLYTCGPEPMLKAVARLADELNLDGEVSMEAPMACGLGICVGCAIPSVGGKYKLCCYDGSVFKIDEVDWERVI